MIRYALLIVGLLLLPAFSLPGQGLTRPGDIPEAFRESPKLMVELDSRRSIFSNRDNQILGTRIGLNFDQKIAAGFGLYFLASRFEKTMTVPDGSGGIHLVESRLRFAYMNAWAEYMLLVTKRWEVSIPVTLGFGEAEFSGFESQTYTQMVLLETSLEAQYKIFPWLGLGAGFGYRQPLAVSRSFPEKLNGPIYRFGVRLFLGYVVKKILGKDD